MSISTAFITSRREDLVVLSHDLAGNLLPGVLDQADEAPLWSIFGSYSAGKSLIAETVASTLTGCDVRGYFESEPGVLGFGGTIHSYFDDCANRQYQFWDIYFPYAANLLFSQREKLQRKIIPDILNTQKRGGIIFLHNAPVTAREFNPAIEISLTEKRKLSDIFNPQARTMPSFSKKLLRDRNLQNDFAAAKRNAGKSPMIRLVQMTIHNPHIFAPDFIEAIESGLYKPEAGLC